MPVNKFALLRYRIIDRCLRHPRRPYPSKDQLREACEEALYGNDAGRISMSTIDKDLWAMRNEGELGYYAPIAYSKDRGGYYYENPDYTIAELPLNDEDLLAIRAAAETLYQFRDIPLFNQFESAIEKIMDRMRISALDKHKREQEVILFERLGSSPGNEFLQPMFLACTERKLIYVDYRKFGSEEEMRYQFAPYIIKEYRSRWYVIGRDATRDRIITLSLDRITGIHLTEEAFNIDQRFDAPAFFRHAIGITVTQDEPKEVVLEVSERLSPYLISQPIHHTQKVHQLPMGKVQIRFTVLLTVELVSTILGYGADAAVIEPPELKSQVKTALIECLKFYDEE